MEIDETKDNVIDALGLDIDEKDFKALILSVHSSVINLGNKASIAKRIHESRDDKYLLAYLVTVIDLGNQQLKEMK